MGAAELGSTGIAQEGTSVEIAEVFPVADVIALRNTGDEAVDRSEYAIDWEHGNEDYTQTDDLDGVTIEAGEEVSVWTGFQSTQIPDVEADYQIGDYGNGRINASEPDVLALLSPDGEIIDVAEYSTDGQSYEEYRGNTDDGSGEPDDGDTDADNGEVDDGEGAADDADDADEDYDEDGETIEDGEEVDDDGDDQDADDGETDDSQEGDDDAADSDDDCPEEEPEPEPESEDDCPEEEPEPEPEDEDC